MIDDLLVSYTSRKANVGKLFAKNNWNLINNTNHHTRYVLAQQQHRTSYPLCDDATTKKTNIRNVLTQQQNQKRTV